MSYVKLHDQLLRSSIMEEAVHVRFLFLVCLTLADRNGNFRATPPALARIANLPIAQVEEALAVLQAPDELSTSDEEDGRRLLLLSPNEWGIVNYARYRDLKDPWEERQKVRERVRRHREKKRSETDCNEVKRDETDCIAEKREKRHPDPDPDPDPDLEASSSDETNSSRRQESELIESVSSFWKRHDLRPKVTKITAHRRAAILARAREYSPEDVIRALHKRRHSRFLSTVFGDGRGAGIDWIFGPKNFPKVLDGNYDDGTESEDSLWVLDMYRQADLDAHGSDELWQPYINEASEAPPRTAPTFEEWRAGRETT
jgi:hypothetical protein